jgi:hypothetical protein
MHVKKIFRRRKEHLILLNADFLQSWKDKRARKQPVPLKTGDFRRWEAARCVIGRRFEPI